ncbi:UPF0236 family transposase-like protein [Candidatus Caldatribacterium sp. SIUC1]|uniref:UPF0236 family transposase-like protein n=1 Tax=Candidatus Caldatribacterium sp. SIUC1 TaxID=3418365 RepID=UPI003F68BEAD
MDFQEFEERLWKTMNTILTPFGDVTSRRTSYRHKDTREYLHLLDDQAGFGKKKRIDPLLEALALERVTELSSQKAGRDILLKNQELTVSPEVVKRPVHNLRKDEKKEEEIPEKKWKPTKKKLPFFIEADEDHVPLKEKRGNHHTKRKKRKKSRILAKLVYVHEGKETSGSGRAKLKNPHYFASCYEDTEELFFEVLEYLEGNCNLPSGEAISLCGDGAPPRERPGDHSPIHLCPPSLPP